jgi:hypothetical protein
MGLRLLHLSPWLVVAASGVSCATKIEGPTFGGIQTVTSDPDCLTATISWAQASDGESSQAHTPATQIFYDVYIATVPGGEDFTQPPAASIQGQTTITVSDLPQQSVVYFVVRARDGSGNQDDNTVEQSIVTAARDFFAVQTVFDNFCAVVGCHVPGDPPRGLVLSDGFSRQSIVNHPASTRLRDGGQIDLVTPYDADVSYLYVKIDGPLFDASASEFGPAEGTLMPAPQTGAVLTSDEIATIENWIQSGAPDCPGDGGVDTD